MTIRVANRLLFFLLRRDPSRPAIEMERGIGKKASFNQLSFADEYDDGWDGDYDDYDGFDYDYDDYDGYDDSCQQHQQQHELKINPKIASAKYLAARSRQQQKKNSPAVPKNRHSSGITISNAKPSSSSSALGATSLDIIRPTYLRYYNRDPKIRILAILDNNSLLHVASFLDLKSIAGWSCTGKFMDEFLSPDALYCKPLGVSLEKNALMLPCAKNLPYHISLLPSSVDKSQQRPKGMARTMAHEADRIFVGNGETRNLAVASHIRCKDKVDGTHLFDQDAIAIVTQTCEVEVNWFGTSPVKGKGNKATSASKSRLRLPSCDELLCSAFHAKKRMVALLSTVTAGRRYMLSLVRLPSFRGDAPEIVLQAKLPPCTLSSSSDAKEILAFNADGSRVLLGTTEKCFVADTQFETNRMYTPGQGKGNFTSVALHDKFLFAVRGRTVSIYDTSSPCDDSPIATGKVDPNAEKPQKIVIFGGRIWLLCSQYLICTPKGILQSLNKLSLGGGGGKAGHTFAVETDLKFPLASSDLRCTFKCRDLLFVSSGRQIRVFDRRYFSNPLVFSASSSITSMFADNTKLVCATKHPNGRSGRVEVFQFDIFTKTTFASILVKKTFQSQHLMHNPQMNGRYLSIAYSYDNERLLSAAVRSMASSANVGGEIQVFDLLRLEGK